MYEDSNPASMGLQFDLDSTVWPGSSQVERREVRTMFERIRQACPECDVLPAPLEGVAVVTIRSGVAPSDCWRCDGFGFVDPYNDDEPTVVVNYEKVKKRK